MELRKLLVALIVLSTIAFTAGAILERSSADTHAPGTGTVLSLVLAAGCWLRPGWRWLLVLTAVAMVAFAALDVREVVHQFDESNAGLGLIALLVAVLHAAAAVTAVVLLSRTRSAEGELAPA